MHEKQAIALIAYLQRVGTDLFRTEAPKKSVKRRHHLPRPLQLNLRLIPQPSSKDAIENQLSIKAIQDNFE